MSKGSENDQRIVFFVQRTVMEVGEYVVCIAEEGTKGYTKTDWLWGDNFEFASKLCDEENEKRGISKKDALKIQCATMRP